MPHVATSGPAGAREAGTLSFKSCLVSRSTTPALAPPDFTSVHPSTPHPRCPEDNIGVLTPLSAGGGGQCSHSLVAEPQTAGRKDSGFHTSPESQAVPAVGRLDRSGNQGPDFTPKSECQHQPFCVPSSISRPLCPADHSIRLPGGGF
jgi:hypothetical protein